MDPDKKYTLVYFIELQFRTRGGFCKTTDMKQYHTGDIVY